jgi:hypothetical protein
MGITATKHTDVVPYTDLLNVDAIKLCDSNVSSSDYTLNEYLDTSTQIEIIRSHFLDKTYHDYLQKAKDIKIDSYPILVHKVDSHTYNVKPGTYIGLILTTPSKYTQKDSKFIINDYYTTYSKLCHITSIDLLCIDELVCKPCI